MEPDSQTPCFLFNKFFDDGHSGQALLLCYIHNYTQTSKLKRDVTLPAHNFRINSQFGG